MAKPITAAQVAAAEADLLNVKESGDPEAKREAMQAVADLRSAFRSQQEASGTRRGFVSTVDNDGGEG